MPASRPFTVTQMGMAKCGLGEQVQLPLGRKELPRGREELTWMVGSGPPWDNLSNLLDPSFF